jgi:flagellar basal-body rod protein FlgB
LDSKLDDYLRFNETALQLRSYRQQLLASNIANADTPHYKARDIDFASKLKEKLGLEQPAKAGTEKLALTKTSPAHIPPLELVLTSPMHLHGKRDDSQQTAKKAEEPLYRDVIQGSVDGNTVDMDVERNNFADNAIRYEAGVTSVSGQIKTMMNAIQPG